MFLALLAVLMVAGSGAGAGGWTGAGSGAGAGGGAGADGGASAGGGDGPYCWDAVFLQVFFHVQLLTKPYFHCEMFCMNYKDF